MERCWSEHGCQRTPLFAWHDGKWAGGKHCAWHAMEKVPKEDELPAYGTSAGLVPYGTDRKLKTEEELRAFFRDDQWEIEEQPDETAQFTRASDE